MFRKREDETETYCVLKDGVKWKECIITFYLFSMSHYIIKTKDLSPVAVYNFLVNQKHSVLWLEGIKAFAVCCSVCAIFTKLKASRHPLSEIDYSEHQKHLLVMVNPSTLTKCKAMIAMYCQGGLNFTDCTFQTCVSDFLTHKHNIVIK